MTVAKSYVLTVAERGRDGELKAFGTRYWI